MPIWGMPMAVAIAVCGAAVAPARIRCEPDLTADDRLDAGFGGGSSKFERAEQIAAVGDRDGRHRLAAAQLNQLLDFDGAGRQRIGAVHPEMDKIGERHGVSMKFGPTSRLAWRRSEYTLLSPGLQDAAAAERVSGFVASARLESVVRPPAMVAPEAPPGSRCHRPGWGAAAQSRPGVSRRLPRAWSPTVGAPSRSCVRTAVS